jgi:hypothetical protein
MSLADMIRGKSKPGKFATATPATVATTRRAEGGTVASVATVAVATRQMPEAIPPSAPEAANGSGLWMGAADEAAIRAWLSAIGEADPVVIGQMLAQCAEKPGLRAYLIGLTDPHAIPDNRRTCRQCANLRGGICTAQANGGKLYRPQVDTLFRCEWYEPGPDDADSRSVWERWPGVGGGA